MECVQSSGGHTLILSHIGTFAVNPFIFDKLPFDINKDFGSILLLAKIPGLYVVNAEVPARNLRKFIALAKSKLGEINYSSIGNGNVGHLAFDYLKMANNMFVLHLHCHGAGPQLTDLLAGP